MFDTRVDFRPRRMETPLDAAEEWLDSTARWPLRILVAAILCPIIISFGGQTELIFYWDHFSGVGRLGSHTLLALSPLIAIGLLVACRWVPSLQARSICCAAGGLLAFGLVAWHVHWLVAVFVSGLVLVVAGNRAARQFTLRRAPRIAAATGGGMLLILGFLPTNGSSAVGAFFTGASWTDGGWMLCIGILGVLVFALGGVGLVVPRIPREIPTRMIRISARATLAWAPACLLFGRLSLGGGSAGINAAADLAGATIAFKVFGTVYPMLLAAANGVAAWMTIRLWAALDAEVPPARNPPDPQPAAEEQPEPVATMAGAPEGR